MQLPNGELSSSPERIREVFTNHFSAFFRAEGQRVATREFLARVRDFSATLAQVPEELAEALTAPVTGEELWETIKGMNVSSAQGPDGIPLSFYKVFYAALRDPILELVNDFTLHDKRPASFSEGHVVLIAKTGGEPSDPRAYRPITLLNADYKVVATILSRSLSEVLPFVISPSQPCSVPGRSISSALALTRDLFTFATRTGIAGCSVSLDQAKAFDRVEHRYLLAILRNLGFPECFVDKLGCSTGVSLRGFLLTGS